MKTLELKLEEFVRCHHLVAPQQTILLAVSGGVDSMALLHLFSRLQKRLKLKLSVVHVNHQLRGKESMEDEEFVRHMSVNQNIPFYNERVNVVSYAHEHGLSKQVAARELRYRCFEKIRLDIGADAVATAHHADDNAETVLLNILRGTGIHGLVGIPRKREMGCIIRPLLFATRSEIESYSLQHGIPSREDSSNRSLVYRRNMLRQRILPVLQKRNPNIVRTLNSIAGIMYEVHEKLRSMVNEVLRSLIKKDSQGCMIVDVRKLVMEPDFLQDEIMMELLHRLHIEPTEKKVYALRRLCTMSTGRSVELSGVLSAWRDREHIVFRQMEDKTASIRIVELGGSYQYQRCRITISNPEPVPTVFSETHEVEYIDAKRLGKQLVLRSWHAGDWFIPLGMKTKKKLSDFFTDQKVPRFQKAFIPVLESDGDIVWICGKRLDNRFKLTGRTQTAVRLTFQSSL